VADWQTLPLPAPPHAEGGSAQRQSAPPAAPPQGLLAVQVLSVVATRQL
jgi:hypothetical protein